MLSQRAAYWFRFLSVCVLVLLASSSTTRADIFRWDNNQLIPGTEGITPGPGVQLDHHELAYAALYNLDLTGSRFDFSNLSYAALGSSTLTNANLSGAVVTGTRFDYTTSTGITKEQLYSTASYQAKNLSGIGLGGNDLSGWDFSGQNLANAYLSNSTLTNANLSGAVVTGAYFYDTTSRGFTKEQLYSTASYQQKNLQGITLSYNLTGWNLNGQNLTDAHFESSTLTNADLSGANLANAYLSNSTLTNANLSGAVVTGTNFGGTTSRGFTKEQLYSTASYQEENLQGVAFGFPCEGLCSWVGNDLTGWNLSGQDLTNASFALSTLTGANLAGANLTNVFLEGATLINANLAGADLRGATYYGDLTEAIASDAIGRDGTVLGLDLTSGDVLKVRDDDGVSDPPPFTWAMYSFTPLTPRPPMPVTVHDHLAMSAGGVLQLVFESDPWESLISFEAGIPVQLGGTLELTFADDVAVSTQVGRTLRIFDWSGVAPAGEFVVESPYVWNLSRLYSTGEVTLLAIPEPTAMVLLILAAVLLQFDVFGNQRSVFTWRPGESKPATPMLEESSHVA
jgi:uncharacterized protein YjbI with pentapeptide repeats